MAGFTDDELPWLTEEEMIEVDRIMVDELGIALIQMMENAGANLARLVTDLHQPATAVVLAGTGGNGGGGLVAARHLANRNVDVTVVLTRRPYDDTVPAHQLAILEAMASNKTSDEEGGRAGLGGRIRVVPGSSTGDVAGEPDVIVDAVIGYSLRGAPEGIADELIEWANRSQAPVVALDVPSGVDVTSGQTPGSAIEAGATMTLAAPKIGLAGSANVGRLFVADISVPPGVYRRLGHRALPVFGPLGVIEVEPD